ncbi:MAG: hypothetical protein GXY85_00340 [Candidatus Brocadiaceae bacterium]|nr:hypothetical protein [Candidatus Brocadiaceae bacterium]
MGERNNRWMVPHPTVESDSFFALIPEAFVYPLRGNGKYLLLMGAVLLSILGLMCMVPIYGFLATFLILGYMASFMFEVVAQSASGHVDMPRWPSLTSFYDDVFVPAAWLIVTFATCMLPFIALLIWGHAVDRDIGPATGILRVVGLACFPMALLGVALNRTVSALNPLAIVAGIARVPLEYAAICTLFVGISAVRALALPSLIASGPFLGYLLQNGVWIYLTTVQMRLLGLLYYTKADALGWFAVE